MIIINEREAIETIKCNKPTSGYSMLCESLDMAIEALEKQIPKKPLEKYYENEGEPPYIKYCCPNGCKIQLIPPRKNLACETLYCPKCGQAIDWRGKDER